MLALWTSTQNRKWPQDHRWFGQRLATVHLRIGRSGGLIILLLLVLALGRVQADEVPAAVPFNRDIRPLLSDRCFACHGPDDASRQADLRLDRRDDALYVLAPDDPDGSEVLRRIRSDDPAERMPPADSQKRPLTAQEAQLVEQWIRQGARYQRHWAYQPPVRPALPRIERPGWARNAIDYFVLRRLEQERLDPSPPADRVTLLRRVYLDLTGLSPTPAQVDAFLQDQRPDAYERVVDRLLGSHHFGQRLAIYWLDLVRFASSVGYHGDQEHAIEPYREYVIDALNQNMPFDQFTIEQLAGDLLPESTVEQKIATGYNRMLQTSHEGGVQQKEYLAKYAADRVRNVSSVWLGATIGCAECHDHKFDPYTQRDFYSLAAFFADVDDTQTFRGSNRVLTEREPELVVLSPIERKRVQRLEEQLQQLRAAQAEANGPDAVAREQEIAAVQAKVKDLQARGRRTMITVAVKPRTMRILERGDWMDESGPVVPPAVPQFLAAADTGAERATRLDLARWIASADNPLTARVFVNRLWYLFYGVGLSAVLDDLGSQGQWPTHPELLDWLAVEFVESGWDIKYLVRLMVTSATYRQSSELTDELARRDPENRYFARAARFRLPAEVIRDMALATSGLLMDHLYGPAARPPQPEGYYANLNFPQRRYQADAGANQYRRSVYLHWQRQYLHPMLKAFDAPSREECTAQRPISNTPMAALTLLNDPQFVEAARALAGRIMAEGGDTVAQRVTWAFRQLLSRPPSEDELHTLVKLYQAHLAEYQQDSVAATQLVQVGAAPLPAEIDASEMAAWTSVARVLFNLNETITRN